MAIIAPINLPYNVRTLWFDPNGLEICAGDKVVVRTARGLELGVAASELKEVDDEAVSKLKSPLKPVVRLATDEDVAKAEEMERLSREAMPVFKDLARQTSEDMHPVSVEYLLDGDKAVFYFEAEERIDFRDLVRQLASIFHVRIDMHQIGVRDEARIVGGLAHCGQEVCCKRLGGEFKPVSIRMAKDQDLSLNPQKISGLCGRLMCCLRYENEAYKDFKARAPKIGSTVHTPDGDAKVVDYDVPREIVTLKVADEKGVKVPLADFVSEKDGGRPDSVTDEGWEAAKEKDDPISQGAVIFSTSQFTGTDMLGSAKAIHHERPVSEENASDSDKPKRSQKRRRGDGYQKKDTASSEAAKPRQRRRRSTTIKGSESTGAKQTQGSDHGPKASSKDASKRSAGTERKASQNNGNPNKKNRKGSSKQTGRQEKDASEKKLRPGHRSSGLSEGRNAASDGQGKSGGGTDGANTHRRRRRRTSNSASSKSEGGTD